MIIIVTLLFQIIMPLMMMMMMVMVSHGSSSFNHSSNGSENCTNIRHFLLGHVGVLVMFPSVVGALTCNGQ